METKKYLFLKSDFENIKREIEKLKVEMKMVSQELKEATTQSSETWHDNAPYDAAMEKARNIGLRFEELGEIYAGSYVVQSSNSNNCVEIGSKVALINKESFEKKYYEIGSYWIGKNIETGNYRRISYQSPLAELLLGKKNGDIIKRVVREKEQSYTLQIITGSESET